MNIRQIFVIAEEARRRENEEPEDRAMFLDGHQLVARSGGPALHVGLGGRVIGQHFEGLAGGHGLERVAGLEDRHRTEESHAIQPPVGDDAHNSAKILTLTRPSGN